MEPETREQQNKTMGPMVGIIVVVVVLVLGGIYFGREGIENIFNISSEKSVEEISSAPDDALEMLKTQGDSDEVTAIEEDLNATNIENLDEEIMNIDKELQAF